MTSRRTVAPIALFIALPLAVAACSSSSADDLGGAPDASATDAIAHDAPSLDASLDAEPGDAAAPDSSADAATGDADLEDSCPSTGTRQLSGTEVATFITEAGESSTPVDLSVEPITVFTLQANGCVTSAPATDDGNGGFAADGLPEGLRYIQYSQLPPAYLVTTATSVDLGYSQLGRSDAVPAIDPNTALAFDVTGLFPLGDSDDFEVFSLGAGSIVHRAGRQLTPRVPIDATSFTGSLAWNTTTLASPRIIDDTRGDRAAITELAGTALGNGESCAAVAKIFELPPFAMMDGQSTSLTGTFVDPPSTSEVTLDWRRSAFAALKPPRTGSLDIEAHVFARSRSTPGIGADGPDLVNCYGFAETDLRVTQTYGNIQPSGWDVVASSDANWGAGFALGTAAPLRITMHVASTVATSSAGLAQLEPLIGPVSEPRLDDHDASGALQNVGTTPLLGWTPPAVGTARAYVVLIYELTVVRGTTQGILRAIFVTRDPELRLLGGILQPNHIYTADISAHAGAIDYSTHPFRRGVPEGRSNLFTGTFEP